MISILQSGNSENKRTTRLRIARSVWVHPLLIFWAAWTFTVFLYLLHLSQVLIFPGKLVLTAVAWIVLPFSFVTILYLTLFSWKPSKLSDFRLDTKGHIESLARRLRIAFVIWSLFTAVEIVISGGVPLQWLIQGSSKTYFDFGIASVHGLLNSLLLAIGLSGFAVFVLTRRKSYLWIPGFVLLWSLIAVTRNMLIVLLLECAITWIMVWGVKLKTLGRGMIGAAAFVLVFGYVGDVRTGIEQFRELAQPSANYPDWLPSGVLWGYIYVSTPINNLVNTERNSHPLNSLFFPNATSLLVPSALREHVYPQEIISSAGTGDLVDEGSWNVSTAFVGPFQDFGLFGVVCLSVLMGWISAHYWRDRSLRGSLVYAVAGQCLAMSIFYNHFFYLPVISQIVWLYMLFRSPVRGSASKLAVSS